MKKLNGSPEVIQPATTSEIVFSQTETSYFKT